MKKRLVIWYSAVLLTLAAFVYTGIHLGAWV